MSFSRFFILFSVSLLAVLPALGAEPRPVPGIQTECFESSEAGAEDRHWTTCIHRAEGSLSQDVLYYFHGRNGQATWWNDDTYYTGALIRAWQLSGRSIPTVISVSFGDTWLLTERTDLATGGLYELFTQRIMPDSEARLAGPVAQRSVVGESMGGINTLMLAFKTGRLFARAASLCPPLPTISPFSNPLALYREFRSNGTSWEHALLMFAFSRLFYPDEDIWRNNDPLQLLANYQPDTSPKLYLSCGRQDDWGCMRGSSQIVTTVESRAGSIEWHERAGGHCDVDTASLADFLVTPRSMGQPKN